MNIFENRNPVRHLPPAVLKLLLSMLLCLLLLMASSLAWAGPGAHGPNGEHLDAPSMALATWAPARVEAASDVFELVAELGASQLVILVDRYETNEPVLDAKIEVETGSHKTLAQFRTDQGDYVVSDAAMLKTLAQPGEHGMVFTLVAGKDSDLLNGTLINAAPAQDDHGHAHGEHGHFNERLVVAAAVAAVGLLLGMVWWRVRRRKAERLQGGV